METQLTISEVAERTGLSAHTLRYYERIGLITPVVRADSGHRRYASADMDWLDFLIRLRATGMPIGHMQAFARLRSQGNGTAGQRRKLLEAHLQQVLADMQELEQSVLALQAKIKVYRKMEGTQHEQQPLRARTRKTARD